MSDRINIKSVYIAGQAKADEEYAERNIGREDHLRGGNAGARIYSKKSKKFKSIGKCPRTSLLRAMGIEDAKDFETKLMFDGGFGSEDYLMKKIEMGWDQGKFIQEGELIGEWELPSGRKVTCTPDGILADREGNPLEIIEAKCMSSGYTVIATGLKKEPRVAHLIQTAQQMLAFDIPAQLVYVSRVNFEIGGYMYNMIGKYKRPWFQYNKDMSVKAMRPHMSVFLLEFRDGVLYYRHSSEKEWTKTYVTKDTIVEYYRHVDECQTKGIIPDKITPKSAINTYAYLECDYCSFLPACKMYDKATFEEWVVACKDISEAK